MGVQGKLVKSAFGYSMPSDAPLYEPFPVYYRDMKYIKFTYITDAASAAELLPAQLELTDPPIAELGFASYPWSNIGAYDEILQNIVCTYKGERYSYSVRLHVTTDRAMAAGREIGGFAKKIGHIGFEAADVVWSYLERPKGLRICSGIVKPEQPVPNAIPASFKLISLRIMPNPEDDKNPSLAQLIGSTWVLEKGELWTGLGNPHFTGASNFDPYHKLRVVAQLPPAIVKTGVLPCLYFTGDMGISDVEILENL